jgi:hypothetical protein
MSELSLIQNTTLRDGILKTRYKDDRILIKSKLELNRRLKKQKEIDTTLIENYRSWFDLSDKDDPKIKHSECHTKSPLVNVRHLPDQEHFYHIDLKLIFSSFSINQIMKRFFKFYV